MVAVYLHFSKPDRKIGKTVQGAEQFLAEAGLIRCSEIQCPVADRFVGFLVVWSGVVVKVR